MGRVWRSFSIRTEEQFYLDIYIYIHVKVVLETSRSSGASQRRSIKPFVRGSGLTTSIVNDPTLLWPLAHLKGGFVFDSGVTQRRELCPQSTQHQSSGLLVKKHGPAHVYLELHSRITTYVVNVIII